MVTSIIQKSKLEGAHRIDAEYFLQNIDRVKKAKELLEEAKKKVEDYIDSRFSRE